MIVLFLAGCDGPKPDLDGERGADESCTPRSWYADADGDGFGGTATEACDAPPDHVSIDGDCDDDDGAIHPGATEDCDGLDQDCDGRVDEDLAAFAASPDADADGYGDADGVQDVCAMPEGWTTDTADCDDSDPAVFPGQAETCNGYDDDCDGLVDDDDSPVTGVTTLYADSDGDGYGDGDESRSACDAGDGWVTDTTDCDDEDASVNPGAEETCFDFVDQDCDGLSDDYACTPETGGDVDLCDPTIVPVDVSLCVSGVAAVLASGTAYGTVQEALDAAASGDVVTVCPGTWTESLTQAVTPLSVVGYGAGTSILAGAGSTTLTMRTSRALTLVDLTIQDGYARSGGGVSGANADLCLARVSIADNEATSDGGGLYLSGTGTLAVEDSMFSTNEAGYAGGGAALGTYVVTIAGSAFDGNYSGYEAGAIGMDSTSAATIYDTEFTGNEADYEGGAITYGGRGPALAMVLTSVTFSENVSGYEAGALSLGSWDDPTVTCVACTFDGNTAPNGGAVNLGSWDAGTFNAALSTFTANEADSGGAILLGSWGMPTVALEACTLEGNTASSSGGALMLDVAGSAGWATVTLFDSTVTLNTAASCGAARVDSNYATLDSVNTDWGAGATDNTPDDVCGYAGYGAGSTFTCTLGTCR